MAEPSQAINVPITLAEGMGLTVQLHPTQIWLHWLTDDQLENLATMNGITAISLAFFGMCVGGWISFYTVVVTGSFRDQIERARFGMYESMAILLSVFFGLIFAVSLYLSLKKLFRVRKSKVISPPTQISDLSKPQ